MLQFDAVVKKTEVFTKKEKIEGSKPVEYVEIPMTRIVLEVEGRNTDIGKLVGTDVTVDIG